MKTLEKTPNESIEKQLNKEEEIENLQNQNKLLIQQIEELTAKLNWYEEQFRLNQQRRFGKSSEKTDPDQLSIFNEAEKESRDERCEPTYSCMSISHQEQRNIQRNS